MKIISVFFLGLLLAFAPAEYEEPYAEEYDAYPDEVYEPYIPVPISNELGHFATATIEDLHAYDNYYYDYIPEPEEIISFDPPPPLPAIAPPRYTSAAVVIMCADTGLVLYGTEHHTQKYPASITKIMTALIVLDKVQDLNERIEFSHYAVFSIPRDSSHIAMDVGETLTVREALYGLMLSSANEVSLALAKHVGGSIEAFADMMNARARELGALNTHFVNPSGLPDIGHVTTAYDMALIMREAVRHPVFVDIIGTRRFDIPPTERQTEIRPLRNTNQLIHPGPYFNEWVVGSKTGWTSAAQHTLVTYASHEGRRLIISVLRGQTFRDTLALMSFGFSLPFEERRVFEAESYIRKVPVYQEVNGTPLNVGYATLKADQDLLFKLPVDFDVRDLRYNLNIPERLTPPIEAGDSLGSVAVYVQGLRAGEVELLAQNVVLGLPPATEAEEPTAGGGEYARSPGYPAYNQAGYPSLAAYYPATRFWENPYLQELALPLAIILVALILTLIIVLSGRKRRMRRALAGKYSRYSRTYRYDGR